jgi:hypothetical protein
VLNVRAGASQPWLWRAFSCNKTSFPFIVITRSLVGFLSVEGNIETCNDFSSELITAVLSGYASREALVCVAGSERRSCVWGRIREALVCVRQDLRGARVCEAGSESSDVLSGRRRPSWLHVVLYDCELWSPVLREETKWRIWRTEFCGECLDLRKRLEKVIYEELNLYCLRNIIGCSNQGRCDGTHV